MSLSGGEPQPQQGRVVSEADDVTVEVKERSDKDGPQAFRGYLMVILAAVFWATGGLLGKWLFTAPGSSTSYWVFQPLGIPISPQVLSAERAFVSFVLLLIVLAIFDRKDLTLKLKEVPLLAVFGVFGLALMHFAYFKAISVSNASTAILLEYLAPVLVFIFAVLFQKQKANWRLPVAIALSLLGCMFVVGAFSPGGIVVSPQGIAWGLTSAVTFATYSLLGGVISKRFSAYKGLVWGLGFAALFWLVVLGPQAVFAPLVDGRALFALIAMAIISTIIPFALFLKALTLIAPAHASMTSMIEPFVVAVGEVLLFGDTLEPMQIIGGVCVVAAIILIQLTPKKQVSEFPPLD